MAIYGFEHLKFSTSTYKHRKLLLIVACISVLVFEYNITSEMKIYSVTIPNGLLKLALIVSAIWTTIQFLFSSIDDFIEWKKNFLIDEKVRPKTNVGDRTVLIELESFSKGKIKYRPLFGMGYQNMRDEPNLTEVEKGLRSGIDQLEKKISEDIKSIEQFKRWYKQYSWLTIVRFTLIDFAFPLLFILYAVVLCRFFPLLPK